MILNVFLHQQLESLWSTIDSCVHTHFVGVYDSASLHDMRTLWMSTLAPAQLGTVRSAAVRMWNFLIEKAPTGGLTYPDQLRSVI